MPEPFVFKKVLYLVEVTGRRARTLDELLRALAVVPAESVGYHMHREFLAYKFAPIEYPNDFAYWSAKVLGDDILGEKLASLRVFKRRSRGDEELAARVANVDPYMFSLEQVRRSLLKVFRERRAA